MNKEISKGFCQCGCGGKTKLAQQTNKRFGWVNGEPVRYILGHQNIGKRSHHWKGGKKIDTHGYVFIYIPTHPKADVLGYIREHILVCEQILGKHLPPKAIPHHVNEDKTDNRPGNLVLCQDRAYHNLLHQRMRALKACGHANWLKCPYCKQWDDPAKMYVQPNTNQGRHQSCLNIYRKIKGEKSHGGHRIFG